MVPLVVMVMMVMVVVDVEIGDGVADPDDTHSSDT